MGGIYKISCAANRHIYIGSAKDLTQRWPSHCKLLTQNRHFNQPLQQAWNRFGARSFSFDIVERIGDEKVKYYLAREATYIQSFRGRGVMLFNTKAMGPNTKHFNQDSINLKIGVAMKYKAMSMSEEDRKRVWGVGRLGRGLSEEHRQKLSTQLRGMRKSVEVRRAMSKGQKESFASSAERKLQSAEVGKRNRGRLPSNAIKYVVDGVEYSSGSHAMRALGITSPQLARMVKYGSASRVEVLRTIKENPSCVVEVAPLYNKDEGGNEDWFGVYI